MKRFIFALGLLAVPSIVFAQGPQQQPSACEVIRGNFASQIGDQATRILELERAVQQARAEKSACEAKLPAEKKEEKK